jgi:hypothetical protein
MGLAAGILPARHLACVGTNLGLGRAGDLTRLRGKRTEAAFCFPMSWPDLQEQSLILSDKHARLAAMYRRRVPPACRPPSVSRHAALMRCVLGSLPRCDPADQSVLLAVFPRTGGVLAAFQLPVEIIVHMQAAARGC